MLMSDACMWMVYVYMCVCLLAHMDTLGFSAALLHRGGSGVEYSPCTVSIKSSYNAGRFRATALPTLQD